MLLSKNSLGIFPIYKPIGITSHDVIYRLRKLTGIQRIGHAGTLDPLASGVLVVAIGREFTKKLDSLMNTSKEYIAEVIFGVTSTTDDAEGEKTKNHIQHIPTQEEVYKVVQHWIGVVDQVPPIFSAIKIKGKPAHRRVRKGQQVELTARKVKIDNIEILKYEWPLLQIKVSCQKGVYIRSLARDIGNELNVGGYLSALERTIVGEFTLNDCVELPSHSDKIRSDDVHKDLSD